MTKPSQTRLGRGMGEGGPRRGGTYVSRLHMVKWKSRGGRYGTKAGGGMSEDIGLEGGLYSQGEVVYISLGPGDYQNEFLKRGGARAIRWSIRNANGRTTASELPSSCNAAVSFFFSGIHGTATRCTKSEAKAARIPHTHCRKKISLLYLAFLGPSFVVPQLSPWPGRNAFPTPLPSSAATCACPLVS